MKKKFLFGLCFSVLIISNNALAEENASPHNDEWINVTLPTKIIFQSDATNKHKTLISSNYEITNHSKRGVQVAVQDYDGDISNIDDLSVKSSTNGKSINLVRSGALTHSTSELMWLFGDGGGVSEDSFSLSGTADSTWAIDHNPTQVNQSLKLIFTSDQTAINVKDSTIYTTDAWDSADNFVNAIDRDGNPIDFSQITVSGTVDTQTPGTYQVTYSYQGVSEVANITVIKDQTAINVKDSTIYTTDAWDSADNFVNAIDRDGNPIDFSQITVSGTVDTQTPGTYQVTYSYQGVSEVANITVIKDQTAINVKDSTIYTTDAWDSADNFVNAIDRDGNPIDFSQITVSGTVDTQTPGTYQVTFSYQGVSEVANITVIKDQTAINVKDSTVYHYYINPDSWKPADNFVSLTTRDGKIITDFSAAVQSGLTYTNSVKSEVLGTYQVTFSYQGVSEVVNVMVVPDLTEIIVANVSVPLGGVWNPKSGFVSGVGPDGITPLNFSQITVSGPVNTQSPGTYQVYYKYRSKSSLSIVTVRSNKNLADKQ